MAWEVLEHTADVGLRLRADGLDALFEDAARGLFEVIAGDLRQVRRDASRRFDVPGRDAAELLHDWLDELLDAFVREHLLFAEFAVRVDAAGARGVARGERHDPRRHRLAHEVKAITYHGLTVRRTNGTWEGCVILDV